ncbi:uncharacterized protein OCT59_015530 [Rhizophagus irregularis]|uniref:uncharacterized protein n=1 Tax=Rhizophagus irregularis TaxID=588596 RepID=UPI003329BB7D|nr:hypothetical protein OCT59_015530 [Rhizophagus irregularis]
MSSQNDIICESCGKIYSYIVKNGINKEEDIIVEWIPYNQFNSIKKLSKDDFATAIWKDGSLIYIKQERKRERVPNKEVTLKYLNNSQDVINDLLNEIKAYSIRSRRVKYERNPNKKVTLMSFNNSQNIINNLLNEIKAYSFKLNEYTMCGISQNPDTNEYVIVFQKNCNCKERGDVVEWIPYNQFSIIEEIRNGDFARVYLAKWKNGLLEYKEGKYKRNPSKEVTLKCLNNSQNVIDNLLNKVKSYSIKINEGNIAKIYGISQNPVTKDYVIVLPTDCNCKKCGEIYTNILVKWCKPCQINNLKQDFVNWTSGNEAIDNFIQKMQLKIERYNDMVVKWIPYNQFNIIQEIR